MPPDALTLLATLELERLPDAILAQAALVPGAAGAALWIADEGGELVLRGWRGTVDRQALRGRLDARQGEVAAAFGNGGLVEAGGPQVGPVLRLPLRADGEPVGLLHLEPEPGGRWPDDARAAAAALAPAAALAVRNARRFQAVERGSLRDRESGAYHLAYLVDHAGKEFYKARRYGRSFSLVIVSLDGLDRLREAAGQEAVRAAARGVVAAVSRVVRDADVLARVSDREFYVLLPETDHFGALMFVRRAGDELRREPAVRALGERAPLVAAMGAATFPLDGMDFDELRAVCRARQEAHRASLVHHLPADLEPTGFWEAADALLGDLPLRTSPSARLALDRELVEAVHREAAREIARDPRARGVLYVAAGAAVAGELPSVLALPRLEAAGRAGDTAARVVVLASRGAEEGAPAPEHPLLTEVVVQGDRRLEARPFLLFLSEGTAYGLLEGGGGRAFHTCDGPLVDALVARLQALYDLQPL